MVIRSSWQLVYANRRNRLTEAIFHRLIGMRAWAHVHNNRVYVLRNRFIWLIYQYKSEFINHNQHIYTLSWRFDLITRSSSEEDGTQFFQVLMRWSAVTSRKRRENKTVLPGGSRKLYISTRKVIQLWIETRAVISWVTPTTAFLMRQLIVASRLGRTEYQLLLMKISWWDRNVTIRCKCLVVIDEYWLVTMYMISCRPKRLRN